MPFLPTPSAVRRAAPRATAAAAALLALTGCVRYDAVLSVQRDDTVDGSVLIAVEDSVLDALQARAEDPLPAVQDMPIGAHVQGLAYTSEGWSGREYVFTDLAFDELAASSDAAHALVFKRAGNNVTFSGHLDLLAEAGDVAGRFVEGDVSIAVTFPGVVTNTNGSLEGHTVTWSGPASSLLEMDVTATDGLEGDRRITREAAVAGVLCLLASGGVVVMLRRRRVPGRSAANS